ncbi:glycosyltransferase family 2 protein [Deinococcus humi]|uniref:GT2 family glycosyltransferase n=1 Tax=Deinococcus humi TaxID=662880 RepID=A0A7W8JV00_9DEIO|nr:glycosyltransferase [Deinococcus humi]MBB5363445.1 GT2 family glycosyltransferase [Deinococcus humi]GGO26469.1 hypothetical protein GCM10008949_17270 [Deinococcus humi]
MESVAICICTYKRYESLRTLLENLTLIVKPDSYKVSIIVVDNDPSGSASGIQADFEEVKYFLETNKGVSSARNRSIEESGKLGADIIAFLDDDEVPSKNWLIDMLDALNNYSADIVAGPVIAELPDDLKAFSPFMARKRHPTGTPIKYWGAGNVLLRAKVFHQVGLFSQDYSETGGEDTQFSARCSKQGLHMVWSDTATVVEPTDATRANPKWLNDRAYANGRIIARVERELNIGDVRRRAVIALLRLLAGVLAWPISLIVDRIFRTRFSLLCSMSMRKGLGMTEEIFKGSKRISSA